MNDILKERLKDLAETLQDAGSKAAEIASALGQTGGEATYVEGVNPFIMGITAFVLAIFVGYYVVWKVTPALHSPLMSVTNAISSVIILGAVIATGQDLNDTAKITGFIAIVLASINIFGGFVVTRRMLEMFDGKKMEMK